MQLLKPSVECQRRRDIPPMLERMGLTGEGAEIGVRDGIYAKDILLGWPSCSKLHLVDPWCELPPHEYSDERTFDPESFDRCQRRMEMFGNRVQFWKCTSNQVLLASEPNHKLDFVFIDANHSLEHAAFDIAAWWKHIHRGGVLAGHDIFSVKYPGVTQAVLEFCELHQKTAYIVPGDFNENGKQIVDASWYILKDGN